MTFSYSLFLALLLLFLGLCFWAGWRVGERTDELRAAFLEDEKRQQAGFQQRLQEAEVQILAEERERFQLVRDELAKRAAEREHALGIRHSLWRSPERKESARAAVESFGVAPVRERDGARAEQTQGTTRVRLREIIREFDRDDGLHDVDERQLGASV